MLGLSPDVTVGAGDRQGGFAAIDALVGLTILASALTLAMGAGLTALKLDTRAQRLQSARSQLVFLMENTKALPGERSGETAGLHWRTRVIVEPQAKAFGLCRVTSEVFPALGARTYALSTLRPCAEPRA
jgi:hypothetical protein